MPFDSQPRYSPDGSKIVFLSDRSGDENIWIANADGSDPKPLTKGKNVRYLSPEWTPGYAGFSPRPAPRLVATRHTHGPALAVSKGLDRDRAVDEGGNQVSIFNRIGARPMTLPEMQRLYLRDGTLYTVSETPTTKPVTR